jgi:hypothetical protein
MCKVFAAFTHIHVHCNQNYAELRVLIVFDDEQTSGLKRVHAGIESVVVSFLLLFHSSFHPLVLCFIKKFYYSLPHQSQGRE